VLDLMKVDSGIEFDGRSLRERWEQDAPTRYHEVYLTECTWMRKEGLRTPQWKLIRALEPDFHGKPPVELYNLQTDPEENHNRADDHPDVVEHLTARMRAWVARREAEQGITNPLYTCLYWSGVKDGPFESSEEAYSKQYIGSASQAKALQEGKKDEPDTEQKTQRAAH
jgi:arylsulfatase A-like enzyme